MTPFGSPDVLDDGRVVVALWGRPFVQFGEAEPVGVADALLFLSARLVGGIALAAGHAANHNDAYLVSEHGASVSLGFAGGNQPVALGEQDGRLLAAVQRSGTAYDLLTIDPLTLATLATEHATMPLTSQGFSGFAGTEPRMTDPVFRILNGVTVGFASYDDVGRTVVGQSVVADQTILLRDGQVGTLREAPCFEPHVSPNGQWWCSRSNDDVGSGAVPANMPPLVAPAVVVPEISPFDHPVTVVAFEGTGSDPVGTEIEAIVRFSEDIDPSAVVAAYPNGRVAWLHDGGNIVPIPSCLRPWDQVWIEDYLIDGEAPSEAPARFTRNLETVEAEWPGDIGKVPMFYGQGGVGAAEKWSRQQVIDAATASCRGVNGHPRVKVLAAFAKDRANGIIEYPERQELYGRVQKASPGPATFVPMVGPEPQPAPQPQPAPVPVPVVSSSLLLMLGGH